MVSILLTIDCDADYFDPSLQTGSSEQSPTWRGIKEGVPLLNELFRAYKGSDGSGCVATWFVRADDQIRYHHEVNSYLFHDFRDYWCELSSQGHEIAWHPHLYKLQGEKWLQETDPSNLKEQMSSSLASIRDAGWKINSSRIGEAYFSNAIGSELCTLAIQADSSCLPGRKRVDENRTIDWINSPSIPYHPSKSDYRIPGKPELPLLEIPFSMLEVKADYDSVPLMRYLDLSFWHHSIKEGLNDILEENRILNTIIHPSTVLTSLSAKPHGLLSFSLTEVRKNLDLIVAILKERMLEYRFRTISQIQREISDAQFK